MGCPPFLLELENGVPRSVGGADAEADHRRLLAAPPEARAVYAESRGTINRPCGWLDRDNNRCRFYDFRPDICRTFEVGGKWCSQARELHQIGHKAARFESR
jgi:Fe-S-cluster containining protein